MVKYYATAVALKVFSSNTAMRSFYRKIGNDRGNKQRSAGVMPSYYPERLRRMLRLARLHSMVRDGDRIMELGTGWLHWEALSLRLFYDVSAILFDVWDNRQLGGLKNYLQQLRPMLPDGFDLSRTEVTRAQGLIDRIVKVGSFEELYGMLGFEYVVESSGSLAQFKDGTCQLVVSGGVLEHVNRDAIPLLIREMNRVLKPGAWALHSVDTSDHLSHYDQSVSKKKYLSFSESTWKRFCENDVQYINRLQRGEWLEQFRAGGFDLVDEDSRRIELNGLRIAERFAQMKLEDLSCTVLRLALRKRG